MPTIAQTVIDRAAAGVRPTRTEMEAIPSAQWDIYWSELSALCPSQLIPAKVKQRNALRIEILPDSGPRCSQKSPDGRGLAWFLSGGDPLAYRACCKAGCPLAEAP